MAQGQGSTLLKGGALLFIGHASAQLLGFIRYFIVARLLVPADFGVAAVLAATLSVLDLASELSVDKLLVQARNGDEPGLMRTVHLVTIVRGLVIGLILWAAAAPIAALMDVPEATPAFEALAIVPLIRGFFHMDVKRFQRAYRFAPDVGVTIASQLAGTLVAVLTAWWFRDYWAILWGTVAQSIVFMVGSHLLADQRYRVGLDRQALHQTLKFGWPLMLNGIVLAVAAQGDRLLIGAEVGMAELGIYAAAAMLMTMPTMLMSKVISSLTLPWIAAVQDDPPQLSQRLRIFGAALAVATLVIYLPLMLLGSPVITLIFGEEYRPPVMLTGWLAMGLALRFLRVWPMAALLGQAKTRILLVVNCIRPVGLLVAAFVLAAGGTLVDAAAALVTGEALALIAGIWGIRDSQLTSWPSRLAPMAVVLASLSACLAWLGLNGAAPSLVSLILVTMIAVPASSAAVLFVAPTLRKSLHTYWPLLTARAAQVIRKN